MEPITNIEQGHMINGKPGDILRLMAEVMAEVDDIPKTRPAKMKGKKVYDYRGIDDVLLAYHKPLTDRGILCLPGVLDSGAMTNDHGMNYTRVRVAFKFVAPDGSWLQWVIDGEAFDKGDKSTAKALSMAMKYGFFIGFVIPTDEPLDNETDTGSYSRRPQQSTQAPKQRPPPPSPDALKDAKTALWSWLTIWHKDRNSTLTMDWLKGVIGLELQQDTLHTVDDVEHMQVVIGAGNYDPQTGEGVHHE